MAVEENPHESTKSKRENKRSVRQCEKVWIHGTTGDCGGVNKTLGQTKHLKGNGFEQQMLPDQVFPCATNSQQTKHPNVSWKNWWKLKRKKF
jgi:hypothetical protein